MQGRTVLIEQADRDLPKDIPCGGRSVREHFFKFRGLFSSAFFGRI